MTIQQLGSYLFDLGFILNLFHSPFAAKLGPLLQTLGMGLEMGQGTIPVKVGNAAQVGQELGQIGFIFGLFKFLQPASAFTEQLGAELAAGVGTFGPIRVGAEGISGVVAANGDGSDTITFTIAAWQGAPA